MDGSSSPPMDTRTGMTVFPFMELPLEIKTLIVQLVDEQDRKYRERIKPSVWDQNTAGASPTDSACYGDGIRQLALCSHEVGVLASQILYSDLTTKMSESPMFLFSILPRHQKSFRSVSFLKPAAGFERENPSEQLFNAVIPSSILLALAYPTNITSLVIEGVPSWILIFSNTYHRSPFSRSLASQIEHLELRLLSKPRYVLRQNHTAIIETLLNTFPDIISLKITLPLLYTSLLKTIQGLKSLHTLDIKAFEFDLSENPPVWTEGSSLEAVRVQIDGRWRPEDWDWIRSLGRQLQILYLSGQSFAETSSNVLGPFYFPFLGHLSLNCSHPDENGLQILPYFACCPITSCLIGNSYELEAKSPATLQKYLKSEILDFLDDLPTGGSKASRSYEAFEFVQNLLRGFCEPRDLTYTFRSTHNTTSPSKFRLAAFSENASSNEVQCWEQQMLRVLEISHDAVKHIGRLKDRRAAEDMGNALKPLRDLGVRNAE